MIHFCEEIQALQPYFIFHHTYLQSSILKTTRKAFNYIVEAYSLWIMKYLPDSLRFVKGLVDSQDLSLNISREMLQHDHQLKLIAGRIEKKVLNELGNMLAKRS